MQRQDAPRNDLIPKAKGCKPQYSFLFWGFVVEAAS